MQLKLRDTFLLANTGGVANPAGAHLMICMAVDRANDRAVIVPVVSQHHFSDQTCLLAIGDHAFIKHDSCVAYDFARTVSIATVDAELAAKRLKLRAPLTLALLQRVQVGFCTSDETPPHVYADAHGEQLAAFLRHKGLL